MGRTYDAAGNVTNSGSGLLTYDGRVAQVGGERGIQVKKDPEGAPVIRTLFANEWDE